MRSSLTGGRVSGLPLIRVIAAGLAGEKVISRRRQHLAKRPALRHDHDWNRAVAGEADRDRAGDAMAGTGGAADHGVIVRASADIMCTLGTWAMQTRSMLPCLPRSRSTAASSALAAG